MRGPEKRLFFFFPFGSFIAKTYFLGEDGGREGGYILNFFLPLFIFFPFLSLFFFFPPFVWLFLEEKKKERGD